MQLLKQKFAFLQQNLQVTAGFSSLITYLLIHSVKYRACLDSRAPFLTPFTPYNISEYKAEIYVNALYIWANISSRRLHKKSNVSPDRVQLCTTNAYSAFKGYNKRKSEVKN